MRKLIILSFVFLLGYSTNAQNKKWTLQECVIYALENNISVKQSQLDIDVADVEKSDAIGNFIPTLNANLSVSRNTGLSFDPTTNQPNTITFLSSSGSINLGYPIFDGLRNFRQIQRAEMSQLASEYRLSKMKDDISLFVANNFLQVLLNKANLDVALAQNAVTKEQIERTQELVDAGMLPQGDLLEVRATDATELQAIAVAENTVKISLVSLAQLLLIKDYETFDISTEEYEIIDGSIADKPVDELINAAKENRSEVKIAETNVDLAKKDVQIAKGGYYPSLSAFFTYSTRYSDAGFEAPPFWNQIYLNDGIGYGLGLNIPVLNGLFVKNNVKRNKINLARSEFQLEQAELDLESTVYQAYVDAKGALASYEAALKANESQNLAYEYAKNRYDVGLTNAFDFSQSKLRLDNSSIEVNRSKYDYIFKLKVLELFFGIPATELKF